MLNDYLQKRREFIEAGRPLPEPKKYTLNKVAPKRAAKIAAEKEARGDSDTEKQKFFKRCIKQMRGVCAETGAPTNKKDYAYAVRSVCHILSQQQCDSVKFHQLNWMEFVPDFHVKFDAMSWEERAQLKCWPLIQEKLVMVYPDLAEAERRHFPQSVLNYMTEKYPFDK